MKLILKVMRTELRNLFYSPVAWFLTIAFLVQCALFYVIQAEKLARYQEMLLQNTKGFEGFDDSLTSLMFFGPQGIFVSVLQNLFIFVPLLTMGLINREFNNGTIKLLYSSPLKTRHLVLGKYMAIMVYNLLLVGIVGIFVVLGSFSIIHVELGWLLSAMLAFLLLVSAYTAIGIYMSSLTSYQIVAAIGTFTVLFALGWVSKLWQQYDFVRDITYFLDMNTRANKLLRGLINTNDLYYFLVIIVMFLGFTMFRMKGAREFKPWYKKSVRYIALIVICLGTGYIFSRPGMIAYYDATSRKVNTIHPNTQAILSQFDKNEPVEVTLYANMLGRGYTQGGLPETRNTYLWSLWERYLRFKPDLKFKYVNFYDLAAGDSSMYKMFPGKSKKEMAEVIARGIGASMHNVLTPEEIRKVADLDGEGGRVVMKLKYKGRSTYLRTFNDGNFWPFEPQVSAAFKRLLQQDMPKLLFTSGNYERNIYKGGEREYYGATIDKSSRVSLVNVGIDSDTINLETTDIPSNISALVVADPKSDLSTVKQQKIKNYIAAGGNIVFTSEPGKQHILNPLLNELGVELLPGTLVEVTKDEMPQNVGPYVAYEAIPIAPQSDLMVLNAMLKEKGKRRHLYAYGATGIRILPGSPFSMTPVMKTWQGRNGWLKAGHLVTDSAAPVFAPQEGDYRDSSFVTIGAFARKINNKEQRLIVSGDSDFLSHLRTNGGPLLYPLFSYINQNEFPIFAPLPASKDLLMTISSKAANVHIYIFLYILPAAVLLLGIVLLIRRKRK